MAPHIFFLVMKATRPSCWFPSKLECESPNLHYQHEPVPGIYHVDSKDRHWLVAINPNSQHEVDRISMMKMGFNKEPMLTCRSPSTIQFNNIKWFSAATKVAGNQMSSETADTIKLNSSKRKTQSATTTNNGTKICTPSHQKSPPSPSCNTAFLCTIFRKQTASKISPIDCCAYKRLARPLKVEFNLIRNRWTFSAEIRARTVITMCVSQSCMAVRDKCAEEKCGKVVKREMFLLDDGISWVVTGDVMKSGKVKKRKNVSTESVFVFPEPVGWNDEMRC